MRSPSTVTNGSRLVSARHRLGGESDGIDRPARQADARRRPSRRGERCGREARRASCSRRREYSARRSGHASAPRDGPSATSSTCTRLRPVSTKAGMRPEAASTISASRRRRAPVARTDRRRRIDDDRREAVLDHGLDQPLGGDLALLIGADRLALGERPRLVGRLAVGATASAWRRSTCRRCARRRLSAAASITMRVPSTLARRISSGSGAHSR